MPDLPQVTISDSDFEKSGWQPSQGWSNMIPNLSTFQEAVELLGSPSDSYELLNAKCYEFFGGSLILTFMDDAPHVIAKIRVLPALSTQTNALKSNHSFEQVPSNLAQAKVAFGLLKLTKQDNMHGLIFERPGLRIACDTNPEPEPIKWIEFFRPGT